MRAAIGAVIILSLALVGNSSCSENGKAKKPQKQDAPAYSFSKDVFPIIQNRCLPCHAEDNFNPSELALDSYESMKAGGKNGTPWVEGHSDESILIKKLSEKPPFGERMPLNSKKKIAEGKALWLSQDQIDTIATWIDQGAKNN